MDLLLQDVGGAPVWNWLLQAIGMVSAYVGAELNARMRIAGFYLFLVSNVALAVLHAVAGLWLLCLLSFMFMRVNCRGLLHWSRERPADAPAWLTRLLKAT